MYDYSYNTYDTYNTASNGIFAMSGGIMAVSGILGLLLIISMWIVFKKAGEKGWKAIIPIYNQIVLLQIVELPVWYIVLYFVPIANIYVMFKVAIELAHKFGKSTGFGVLTVFFPWICYPILAFSKVTYTGNNTQTMQNASMNQPTNPQPTQMPSMEQPVNPQPMQAPSMNQPTNPQPMQAPSMEQPVNPQPMQAPSMEQPVNDPTTKSCPNCGNTLMSTDIQCNHCGYRF